jgi:drug/metabolite transporter (DMT)-like permease
MLFEKIPIPFLFVITTLTCIISQTVNAFFAKRNNHGLKSVVLRNLLFVSCIAVVILVLSRFQIKISPYTLLLSALFGLVYASYFVTTLQAYKYGPYGYTSVIISLSTVISALSGFMFFGEDLGVLKIVGVVLMIFCFIFATDNKKDDSKKTNLKWFILSIVSMFLSSMIGILQKTHQSSAYKHELTGFLVLTFSISALFFLIFYLVLRKIRPSEKVEGEEKTNLVKLIVITALVSGVFAAFNNCINLYLSGTVESVSLFPIINGIPLMGGVIISFVLFKERLKPKQIVGLIFGLIAIVMLCI